jgi:hypothetical protein
LIEEERKNGRNPILTFVSLTEPCFYHNLDPHYVALGHAEQALRWFGCPEEWLPPVCVMAQGAYHYGADAWMTEFAA